MSKNYITSKDAGVNYDRNEIGAGGLATALTVAAFMINVETGLDPINELSIAAYIGVLAATRITLVQEFAQRLQ